MSAAQAEWPHLFRPGSVDAPVLLMLHGTGGDEQQISGLAAALDPRAAVLAPRGRVVENGMNRWFRRLSEGVFDTDDVARRADDLAGFLVWAREYYELGDRPLVAVGFSNGANIALALALLRPEMVPRVIAFSGMHPLDGLPVGGAGARVTTSGLAASVLLLLNGDSDPMAPLSSVHRLVSLLEARGATVEQVLRPGGHGIADSDVAAALRWLA
ncbi:carboxylesterase [Cryobacterium sp. TMT1-3]|uniref:alpha/beta hydrolase n=1 Tax=Cryobacterium sp. TMT1-3 TaxID=1259237 RepID=UPI0010698849|nr:alpha/beta hydrolase-fold protein [Cryobacterium sp. TMT1-3]TFC27376.1 carboxylesterase [Cryobacterium sp. TMT1-3]